MEKREYSITLFISHRPINKFMEGADLRPDGKWYIQEIKETTFTTDAIIDKDYLLRIINTSKEKMVANGFWVPAIKYNGALYAEESVRVLSDGNVEMFI